MVGKQEYRQTHRLQLRRHLDDRRGPGRFRHPRSPAEKKPCSRIRAPGSQIKKTPRTRCFGRGSGMVCGDGTRRRVRCPPPPESGRRSGAGAFRSGEKRNQSQNPSRQPAHMGEQPNRQHRPDGIGRAAVPARCRCAAGACLAQRSMVDERSGRPRRLAGGTAACRSAGFPLYHDRTSHVCATARNRPSPSIRLTTGRALERPAHGCSGSRWQRPFAGRHRAAGSGRERTGRIGQPPAGKCAGRTKRADRLGVQSANRPLDRRLRARFAPGRPGLCRVPQHRIQTPVGGRWRPIVHATRCQR